MYTINYSGLVRYFEFQAFMYRNIISNFNRILYLGWFILDTIHTKKNKICMCNQSHSSLKLAEQKISLCYKSIKKLFKSTADTHRNSVTVFIKCCTVYKDKCKTNMCN